MRAFIPTVKIHLLFLFFFLFLFAGANSAFAQNFGFNVHSLGRDSSGNIANILNYLAQNCQTNIVRFFGYEGWGGYDHIQKVLDAAPPGMKFIIALEDFPYGPPEPNPKAWFSNGYKASYRPYVQKVVSRYAGNSKILVWEIMNEPHCKGDTSCSPFLLSFMDDVSGLIRSIDPGTYVSPGVGAGNHTGEEFGGGYNNITALPNITANSCHFYYGNPSNCLTAFGITSSYGKFFYVGEAGYVGNGSGVEGSCTSSSCTNVCDLSTLQQRAAAVQSNLSQLTQAGIDTFIIWQFSPEGSPLLICDKFSVFPHDPICEIDADLPYEPPLGTCPVRGGTKVLAAPAPTPSALKEKVQAECTGNWFQRKICDIIKAIIDFFRDESFQYKQTAGSAALHHVQQQALNSESPYEGIIARMLPPQYRQMGLDPMLQLSKAEGQKAEGEIISNQGQPQENFSVGSGEYRVEEGGVADYVIRDAKFPDIPALVDKYGFIRQGFVPGAPLASLPYVNCPTSSPLIEFEEVQWTRDVQWEAETEGGEEVPCVPNDPDDPDCREEPLPHPPATCPGTCTSGEWFNPPEEEDQEEETPNCGYCGCQPGYSAQCNAFGTWSCLWNPGLCGDDNCPCTGATSVYVEAPVDTQTDVALVGEAWQNIAGGSETDASGNILKVGGALDIFTLPGSNFKQEPSLEAESPFTYQSLNMGDIQSQATLPIARMGGVEGAFGCVVDQLLEPPANAAEGICEEWMENIPGEEEEESYIPTRQAVLGQRTAQIQQGGGFWANLGSLVGRLLRSILSL